MARHHRDPAVTFHNWNDVWLSEEFRSWDLRPLLAGITAPVLAIQGTADPYGTVLHVEAVRDGASGPVELLVLDCAHAPHLEATEPVTAAVVRFLASLPSAVRGVQPPSTGRRTGRRPPRTAGTSRRAPHAPGRPARPPRGRRPSPSIRTHQSWRPVLGVVVDDDGRARVAAHVGEAGQPGRALGLDLVHRRADQAVEQHERDRDQPGGAVGA